jgi:hypothetical protein
MGYRNNGTPLQPGFEGYEKWANVPFGVKHLIGKPAPVELPK